MAPRPASVASDSNLPKASFRVFRFLILCGALLLPLNPAILFSDEYSKVQHYSVRMFSYGTLTLDARTGDIDIEGWDNPRLSIEAEKVVRAGSEKKAEQLYGRIQVHVQGRDHRVRISTVYPKRRLWRPFRDESQLSVNFTIRMPYDANLKLKCVDGDVTVSDLTGAEILNVNYGDVEIDVPDVYGVRLLEAHSWLGYVQSDLHGMPEDGAGFSKTLSFSQLGGRQVIVVRVRMGGVFVYGEQD
jgi:hypothetical protein